MSHTTPTTEFPRLELPSMYGKAIAAIAGAVLIVLLTALDDDVITLAEILGMVVALATAVLVYLVPNIGRSGLKAGLKFLVVIIGTLAQAAIPFATGDGFTSSAIVTIVLAALTAISVGIVPNPDPQTLIPDDVEPIDASLVGLAPDGPHTP